MPSVDAFPLAWPTRSAWAGSGVNGRIEEPLPPAPSPKPRGGERGDGGGMLDNTESRSTQDEIEVNRKFAGAEVGGLVLDAGVQVGPEPVLAGGSRHRVLLAVVEDRHVGLEEDVAIEAVGVARAAAGALEVGPPLRVAATGGPLRQDKAQGRLVAVEGGAAGDQEVIRGVADDAVGSRGADEQVAVAAADQQVVADTADED